MPQTLSLEQVLRAADTAAALYTLQQDAHGNRIVCKGDRCRNGYRVIWRGTYAECQRYRTEGCP